MAIGNAGASPVTLINAPPRLARTWRAAGEVASRACASARNSTPQHWRRKMRVRAILAAVALVAAPVLATPGIAFADGIERPRQPRPRPRPAPPPAPAPEPAPVIETGPETVTLSEAFFAGGGGVGGDIGVGGHYSSTTVVIRGGSAHASAFSFASARASARSGGRRGGGHGCGCR